MKNRLPAVRVVVPYYGLLIRAGRGLEQIYFLAQVNSSSGDLEQVTMQVWNAREYPSFPEWLATLGVRGLVCSDSHPEFEQALLERGIRVCWAQDGDLPDVVRHWTRAQAA